MRLSTSTNVGEKLSMKRKLKRSEILNLYYLRRCDIMQLMGIERQAADKQFEKAKRLEKGTDPIYINRVEMPYFIKANNVDFVLLTEQIIRQEELEGKGLK